MAIDRTALLTEILRQPADSSTWVELTTLINSWPEAEGLEAALKQAEAALSSWPDSLRTANSWWFGASKGSEPRWRLARSLSFSKRFNISTLGEISQNDAFRQVTNLRLTRGGGPDLIEALAQAISGGGAFDQITGLDLNGREIGADGAAALAKLELPALEWLDLSRCDLGKAGIEALVSAPWVGQLRHLSLAESRVNEGAAAALGNGGLKSVEFLRFRRTPELDDAALAALSGGEFPELRDLNLEEGGFGPEGLAALGGASHWKKLEKLNLSTQDRAFGDDGAKALASTWSFPAVGKLNIGGNKIGDSGAKALAGCDGLSSVHTLNIARAEFNTKGMKALANSKAFSGVRSIYMNWCKPNAIKAMGGSPLAENVEKLEIPRTSCKDVGLLALLEGDGLANVHHLDLTKNKLTDSAIEVLVGAADKLTQLRTLVVQENSITGRGLGMLGSGKLELHALNLRYNKLGADAVDTITSGPLATNLQDVNLKYCGLGESGFSALCKGEFPELQKLVIETDAATVKSLGVMVENAGNFPRLREFAFQKGLFSGTPKDQLDVLQTSFPLARAAINGGVRALRSRLPEFASLVEKPEPEEKPKAEGLPTAVFELPDGDEPINLANCSSLAVLGQIGLGSIDHALWQGEEAVVLKTANGLYRYELETGSVELISQSSRKSVGLSDDGRLLGGMEARWDGKVVDLETGKETTTWDIKVEQWYQKVAFSPDNTQIAMLSPHDESFKSLIRVRTLASGAQWEYKLSFSISSRTALTWSPDGKFLAVADSSWHVILSSAGQEQAKWAFGDAVSACFTRDSAHLITGTREGNMSKSGEKFLRVWDLEGKQVAEIATPSDAGADKILAIATHPDGKSVAVGGEDKHVHIFDSSTWKRTHLLKQAELNRTGSDGFRSKWSVGQLGFSPDGSKLLVRTDGDFGSLQVWDTTNWKRTALHSDFVDTFNNFALFDDGVAIATTSEARSYRSGVASPKIHKGWKGPWNSEDIDYFAPLSDGKQAVLVSGAHFPEFTFGVLDLETMELDASFRCPKGPRVLAINPVDDLIAIGDEEGRVTIFKPGRKSPVTKHRNHHDRVSDLTWSADGTGLASCAEGKLCELRPRTRTYNASGERPRFGACALSSTGEWLAGAVTNRPKGGPYTGKVLIWPKDRVTPLEFAPTDKGGFNALVFSPDDEVLATGDSSGRIRLLRTADASLLAEYQAHSGPITGLRFDTEGGLLYSMAHSGQIKIWGVGPDESEYLIAKYDVEPLAVEPEPAKPEPAKPAPTPVAKKEKPKLEPPNWEAVEAGEHWTVRERWHILNHKEVGWIEVQKYDEKMFPGRCKDLAYAKEVCSWNDVTSEPIPAELAAQVDEHVAQYLALLKELRDGPQKISILLDLPNEKKALAELGGTPMRLLFKGEGWAVVDLSGDPSRDISDAMFAKVNSSSYGKFKDLAQVTVDAVLKGVAERGEETTIVFDPPLIPPPVEKPKPKWFATYADVEKAVADRDMTELKRIYAEGNTTPDKGKDDANLLHAAARKGYLEAVKLALEGGCDVNQVECQGSTPLRFAVKACADIKNGALSSEYSEAIEVIDLLLEKGADPAFVDNKMGRSQATEACVSGCTDVAIRFFELDEASLTKGDNWGLLPIHLACIGGSVELLEWLAEHDADPHALSTYKMQPIHVAAENGRLDAVKWLVERGADCSVPVDDDWGTQPIHYASQNGRLDVVKWLVENGADLKSVTKFAVQPIHYAAMGGRVELLAWFVEQGMEPTVAADNDWGEEPIHYAAQNGHLDAMKWLKDNGADPLEPTKAGMYPFHSAAKSGSIATMEWLVELGADLNGPTADKYKTCPIHCAAQMGRREAVEWLVEKGADLKIKDNHGSQAIHHAAYNGHNWALMWIVKHEDVDLNAVDSMGFTGAHEACVKGHVGALSTLIQAGIDKSIKSTGDDGTHKAGMTAKEIAEQHGHQELVDMLS